MIHQSSVIANILNTDMSGMAIKGSLIKVEDKVNRGRTKDVATSAIRTGRTSFRTPGRLMIKKNSSMHYNSTGSEMVLAKLLGLLGLVKRPIPRIAALVLRGSNI